MKLALFVLAPFQTCEIIVDVIFTIVFSPVGPKYAQTSTGNLQYSTANTALSNACLVGMGMAILLPGLMRTDWNLKGAGVCHKPYDSPPNNMLMFPFPVEEAELSRFSKLSAPPAYAKGSCK